MKDINTEARKALESALPYVKSQNDAEGMLEGFGGRKPRPSDGDLQKIEAAIVALSPPAVTDISGQDGERARIDANRLEQMAKERPNECFLKGSGVLKLTGAIRQLGAEIRALSQPPAVQVPPGWKLVPVEPTEVMQQAWDKAPFSEDIDEEFRGAYRVMISASPSPAAVRVEEMPGWISVDERRPKDGETVLVSRFAGRVSNKNHLGYPGKPWVEASRTSNGTFLCDVVSTGGVTHWMPLPPPPAAKKEGNL